MVKELIKPLIVFLISVVAFAWILFWDSGNSEKEQKNLIGKNFEDVLFSHSLYSQYFHDFLFDEKTDIQIQEEKNLTIAVPENFLQYGLQNFFDSFQKDWITISILPYLDFISVKKDLQKGKVDIALLPYEQIRNEEYLPFWFEENLVPYFKTEVLPLVNDKKIQFLPYGIDPLWFFSFSGNFTDFNFQTLQEFLQDWQPKKSFSFPLWFGIRNWSFKNPDDIDLTTEIFWNELFEYSQKSLDDTFLSGRLNAIFLTNVKGKFQDFEKNMQDIQQKVNPQIEYCKEFQKECLFLYRFVDVIPWFFSDKNLFITKFPQRKELFDDIQFFPSSFSFNPIRVWGRVASPTIDDPARIYSFLEQYMGLSFDTGMNIRSSMIPAFSWSNFQSTGYEIKSKTKIITESNFLTKHKTDIALQQLLDYDIEAKDYLGS